ncbi:MAG: hypothetical protein AAFX79_07960 [Planctomycetota bacterium]
MRSTRARQQRSTFSVVFGRGGFSIALALLLFTALIWLRLRIVTDVPRMAYAEPENAAAERTDGASDAPEARDPDAAAPGGR